MYMQDYPDALRRLGRAQLQEAPGRGRAAAAGGGRSPEGKVLDGVARRTPLSLVTLDRCVVGAGVDKGQARVNRSVVIAPCPRRCYEQLSISSGAVTFFKPSKGLSEGTCAEPPFVLHRYREKIHEMSVFV
jgi:hypothetical protein